MEEITVGEVYPYPTVSVNGWEGDRVLVITDAQNIDVDCLTECDPLGWILEDAQDLKNRRPSTFPKGFPGWVMLEEEPEGEFKVPLAVLIRLPQSFAVSALVSTDTDGIKRVEEIRIRCTEHRHRIAET